MTGDASVPAGALDVHVHAEPSLWERKHDAPELARRYRDAGLGFLLKSHFGSTADTVDLVRRAVPDAEVHAALTLNTFVGGLNPSAVELGIERGVSLVWLPTFSAANFGTDRPFPFAGQDLTVIDADAGGSESGDGSKSGSGSASGSVSGSRSRAGTGAGAEDLTPAAAAVLETLADADRAIPLGNGHVARAETFALLDYIEAHGLDLPYLVTHPDSSFMGLSPADQVELADRGAYIEKCYRPVVTGDRMVPEMAADVERIGAGQCVVSTDHGQPDCASPPEAYAAFVGNLRAAGLDDGALRTVCVDTPRELLPPLPDADSD